MKAKFYRVLALIMGLLLILQATPAWAAIQGDSGVQSVLATISGTVTSIVTGNVASNATDSGNPVKVGCVYHASGPTSATDGQRIDCQADAVGNHRIAPTGTNASPLMPNAAALADGSANPTTTSSGADQLLWNGSTWDRQVNNQNVAGVFGGSTTFSSTQISGSFTNYNARGIQCAYDVTAVVGVGSFTLTIQGQDNGTSGKVYTLLTTTAVSTVSTNVLTVYPGVTPASTAPNFAASQVLPRTWRIVATYNSGTSQTFTVGCTLIL